MNTHPYEYTHTYPVRMSTSKKLIKLDLEIHEAGHEERLAADGNINPLKK
jgi:hypothetical protein